MVGAESPSQAAAEAIDRIPRRTLHEEVATRVRDMIIEGVLEPGARINEVQLGARLGVSRTPLREAIRTLSSEGLIDLVPSRGAVVRRLTPEAIYGMLEALALIEPPAGRLGCERASDGEIAHVLGLHGTMMERYAERDRLPYYKLNQAIHTAIVALAHNQTVLEIHSNLQGRLKRIRFLGNGTPEKWSAAVAEHEAMAEALGRRDGAGLAAVLERHLWRTWDRVREIV